MPTPPLPKTTILYSRISLVYLSVLVVTAEGSPNTPRLVPLFSLGEMDLQSQKNGKKYITTLIEETPKVPCASVMSQIRRNSADKTRSRSSSSLELIKIATAAETRRAISKARSSPQRRPDKSMHVSALLSTSSEPHRAPGAFEKLKPFKNVSEHIPVKELMSEKKKGFPLEALNVRPSR